MQRRRGPEVIGFITIIAQTPPIAALSGQQRLRRRLVTDNHSLPWPCTTCASTRGCLAGKSSAAIADIVVAFGAHAMRFVTFSAWLHVGTFTPTSQDQRLLSQPCRSGTIHIDTTSTGGALAECISFPSVNDFWCLWFIRGLAVLGARTYGVGSHSSATHYARHRHRRPLSSKCAGLGLSALLRAACLPCRRH
jgi:hypothetical protein